MDEFMTALSAIANEPLPGAPVTDLEWSDEPRLSPYAAHQRAMRTTNRHQAVRKPMRKPSR